MIGTKLVFKDRQMEDMGWGLCDLPKCKPLPARPVRTNPGLQLVYVSYHRLVTFAEKFPPNFGSRCISECLISGLLLTSDSQFWHCTCGMRLVVCVERNYQSPSYRYVFVAR
jgi:hypothetical protein